MTFYTTLDIVRGKTYSPLEKADTIELQAIVRVKQDDVISYFKPFSVYPFFSTRDETWPERLVRQELHYQHLKHPLNRKIFSLKNCIHNIEQLITIQVKSLVPRTSFSSLFQTMPLPLQRTEKKTYFDEEFKTHFFVPISFAEVNRFVEKFQVEGGYCGLGCTRKTKLKNLTKATLPEERCDIIALTKHPRQVEHEAKKVKNSSDICKVISGFWKNCIHHPITKTVKTWQASQARACEHITKELEGKIKEWNYDSFMIAGERRLLMLGYSEEASKKMHLLALFYKKVPMPTYTYFS